MCLVAMTLYTKVLRLALLEDLKYRFLRLQEGHWSDVDETDYQRAVTDYRQGFAWFIHM